MSSATARFRTSRDGLKPVQRRILWALHEKDDGRFIKVANVVGHTMQYHPHGDASIGDALVVLANKRYLIEGQGNFGNIFTGDPAAAPRYIECRLTELARTEVFNDEITDFVPSYDGRNKEPVTLPCKLPLTLMLGTEGIAVGLSARILPHNFPELLEAQIAILKKQPFKCLPDFPTGGLMDARDYQDGKGSVKVRARIKTQGRIHRGHHGNSADHHDRFAHRLHRRRGAQGQDQGQIHQRFHVGKRRDRNQMSRRRGRGKNGGRALRLHRLRDDHRQPHRRHQGQPPGGNDRQRSAARKHRRNSSPSSSANWNCARSNCSTNCITARSNAFSSRSAFTKRSSNARRTRPSSPAVYDGFKPFKKQSCATSWTRTWKNCCRSASAAFRCSTSTSTARKWKRPRRTWKRRARI